MGEGIQHRLDALRQPGGEGIDLDVLAIQLAQRQEGGDGDGRTDLHQLDVAADRRGKQLAAEDRHQRHADQQQQD
ncbi:hypothetical protein D3C78_1632880 [compost metagenome]